MFFQIWNSKHEKNAFLHLCHHFEFAPKPLDYSFYQFSLTGSRTGSSEMVLYCTTIPFNFAPITKLLTRFSISIIWFRRILLQTHRPRRKHLRLLLIHFHVRVCKHSFPSNKRFLRRLLNLNHQNSDQYCHQYQCTYQKTYQHFLSVHVVFILLYIYFFAKHEKNAYLDILWPKMFFQIWNAKHEKKANLSHSLAQTVFSDLKRKTIVQQDVKIVTNKP